jgi:hypothetical protein
MTVRTTLMCCNRILRAAIAALMFVAICQTAYAAETSTFHITVNTTPLVGNPAGPFSIAVALTDGYGLGNASSTVTVTDVAFGGGKGFGDAVQFGGTSGNLETGVTLTTSSFLSLFVETFLPGSKLDFTLSLTTASRGHHRIPDRLTIFILDGYGMPIATTASVADFFVGVSLTSEDPRVEVFGSDPSRPPFTGTPISIPPPRVED